MAARILVLSSIMLESFIKFPVHLDLVINNNNKRAKKVKSMPDDWKHSKTTSIPASDNYGILTGAINNITVVDISANETFDWNIVNTFKVRTPSQGMHLYFQYEANLNSIYNVVPNISVLNDNCCVFFGSGYRVIENLPIAQMPQVLVSQFSSQRTPTLDNTIDLEYYDLLNILDNSWFNKHELIIKLVHLIRNTNMPETMRIPTLRKLTYHRSMYFNDDTFIGYFQQPMNSIQKRYKIATIAKVIKNQFPVQYNDWLIKWHPRKADYSMLFKYKKGAFVKISSIQAKYKRVITPSRLAEINPEFTVATKHVCKSCLNPHLKGCCDDYSRTNRTSCVFVNNIELVD